jgi:hypothetical protein
MPSASSVPALATTPPLPVPSSVSTSIGDLRLGVEWIATYRYFILYSTMTGDESRSEVSMVLEDLSFKALNPAGFRDAWAVDENGQVYRPTPYRLVEPFPADNPLGWKVRIKLVFAPFPAGVENVVFNVLWDDQRFVLPKAELP